jgi:hypothetical protein
MKLKVGGGGVRDRGGGVRGRGGGVRGWTFCQLGIFRCSVQGPQGALHYRNPGASFVPYSARGESSPKNRKREMFK